MNRFQGFRAVDSVHGSDLHEHPDYYVAASFVVGWLFMSSIQYILYSPLSALMWNLLVARLNASTGRHTMEEDTREHDTTSTRARGRESSTPSGGEGGLILKRVPALTLTMYFLVAMTGAAKFASLLTFDQKSGAALCAFEIAWGSMSIQSARLIGLTIIGFNLRIQRITHWEGWAFIGALLALTGLSLVTVVLGNGVLRPATNPQSDVFNCYHHNFQVSLATSLVAMVIEGYSIFRNMYLLTPPSARLLQSLQVVFDVRVVRGCSLFLLDANLLLASSGAAGFYGEFVPVVVSGIVVMVVFNANDHYSRRGAAYIQKSRLGTLSPVDFARSRSDSTFSLIGSPRSAEGDYLVVGHSPIDGRNSARSKRTAPGVTDVEAQYAHAGPNDHKLKQPPKFNLHPFDRPRAPLPTASAGHRLSNVPAAVSRSVGQFVQAASNIIALPILPKATLAQRFEEHLRGDSTEFISGNTDPRARYSYAPPSVVSNAISRDDGYSDVSTSEVNMTRRNTVTGGPPTVNVNRKASAAVSVVTTATTPSDYQYGGNGRRPTKNMKRHNTFGYKDSRITSYASTTRRATMTTRRETLGTLPRTSDEMAVSTSNVSRSTTATSSSVQATNSRAGTPSPPELPSKPERFTFGNSPPPDLPLRSLSTKTYVSASGGAFADASSAQPSTHTDTESPQTDVSVTAKVERMTSGKARSALSRIRTKRRLSRSITASSARTDTDVGTDVSSDGLSRISVAQPQLARRTRIEQAGASPSAFAQFVQGRYVNANAGDAQTAVTTSSTRESLLLPVPLPTLADSNGQIGLGPAAGLAGGEIPSTSPLNFRRSK